MIDFNIFPIRSSSLQARRSKEPRTDGKNVKINHWREMLVGCSIDWKFNADFKNGIKRDKISSRSWVMTLFVDSNHVKFSKVMFPESGLKKRAKIKNPKSNSLFKVLPCQGKWLILTFFPYVRVPCQARKQGTSNRWEKRVFNYQRQAAINCFLFSIKIRLLRATSKKEWFWPPLKNEVKFKCS